MPNTVAKIVRNDAGGIVAKDVVRRENAQRRTSNAQLRSLEDRGMNPIGRARKSNARNIPREVIEDLHVAMIAGPARRTGSIRRRFKAAMSFRAFISSWLAG